MTPLESKALRDSYGIDTFERGFIYAALLLRASNTDPNNTKSKDKNKYYNAVRIAFDFDVTTNQGTDDTSKSYTIAHILVQAKIPYNSASALKHGGYFFKYLGEYGNNNPNPFALVAPPTAEILGTPYYLIYDDPNWIDTLEKYLVWCALNLICGFEADLSIEDKPVKLQILEEDALGSSVQIEADLEFSYKTFLQTNNVISAINQLTKTGCQFTYTPTEPSRDTNIGNNSIISNDSFFGN